MEGFKEVTQEQFYEKIGKLDVTVSIENEYVFPYTSLFKLRSGTIVGKSVDYRNESSLLSSKYFLKKLN